MGRAHLEMLANYLVTHGVSVPREGQAHLVSGFYFSIRAWLEKQAGRLCTLLKLPGRLLQA
jgi:hypothetical protein